MKKIHLLILTTILFGQIYAQQCSKELKGTVYIDTKHKKAVNATVNVKDVSNNILKSYVTSTDGAFHFDLDCNMKYKIEAIQSGLKPVEFMIITRSNKDITPKNIFLQSIKVEKKAIPIKEIKKKGLPKGEITYGNNEWDVSKRVLVELNEVIELMEINPSLTIYFESHTDKRGDKNNNMKLTQKRIASLIKYVATAGISKDRISGNAFGETRPLNGCGFMGQKCSQKEFLKNRRTTFVIRKN